MSIPAVHHPHAPKDHQHDDFVLDTHRPQDRRVAMATLAGTTIEWYDYFIYANAAALVFGPRFFSAVPENMQMILSFATVGVSFLFRPLGASVAGHYGDRIGRKAMLVLTLVLMGGATALIGVLPSAASIGIWAPILLILLRIIQGFSAGGEWGGAALMAVEHAPADQRGKYGSFPQMGVPLGMLVATGFLAMLSVVLTDEQFASWGWRVPFIGSLVLIAFGFWIRMGVEESPVFKELEEHPDEVSNPLGKAFRFTGKQVAQAAILFMGNGIAGYMVTGGFILAYTTKALHMPKSSILNLVTLACLVWFLTTWLGGIMSDRIGRVRTYQIGFIAQLLWVYPMFMLVNQKTLWGVGLAMIVLTIGIGLTYGPQAALFAEIFPAQIRYSGAAISYALGAILGGAFAPLIAQWLVQKFHTTVAVSTYLFVFTLIAFVVSFTIKDRTGKSIDKDAMDIPGAPELERAIAAENAR